MHNDTIIGHNRETCTNINNNKDSRVTTRPVVEELSVVSHAR